MLTGAWISVPHPGLQDDDSCPDGLCSFNAICAILFPMFSGVLSGANLSGDMRDPSQSIPKVPFPLF